MKVIMIDDDKAMHFIISRMLGKMDEIEIAGSFTETTEAYTYLSSHEADLIFMDIQMPGENGLVFAARLRENGINTKLIFVSSHKEFALSAFDVYAFDYITKPINQERLHRTVRRAISELSIESRTVEPTVPAAPVRFYCFGGLEIRSDQNVLIKWKTSKSSELFGYLLIQKGRMVSRARIIEDLFGEMPQKNAESYLNTTVYQLRKMLDNYGLKENLYSDSNHYALYLNRIGVDIISFEEGCKQLAVVDPDNMAQALEIEQLYTGDLFGDRAFPWSRAETERLSLLYTSFAQKVCDALLVQGDTPTAIRLLKKLSAHNELDEHTFKLHMKANARMKNKEALSRQYILYTEMLHKEMGIGPSSEVIALYRQHLADLNPQNEPV